MRRRSKQNQKDSASDDTDSQEDATTSKDHRKKRGWFWGGVQSTFSEDERKLCCGYVPRWLVWSTIVTLIASGVSLYYVRQAYSERLWIRPGKILREEGLRPKHPVVVVPGFVTSGLELWHGEKCAEKFFRERIWGSMTMTQAFIGNSACWFEHMQLDMGTGMDPESGHIKLRAAEGLEAVDFFFPGYHVWAKLIESLADLGYDSNNLVGVTYDWRLAVPLLEQRDGYFTKLKGATENAHKLHKQKAVLVSHSWGDNVFRNFMRWAENQEKGWCDKHIEAYVNIAGPVLGVPKAVTAALSGEMRDTAQLGNLQAVMTERWMPRVTRSRLFRSWGSIIGMLPVGGPNIWGNATWAPDDTPAMRARNESHGAFIAKKEGPYPWNLSFRAIMDAISFRSIGDKVDLALSKCSLKGRRERRKKFLDPNVYPMDIDQAMHTVLEVAEPEFKTNVELYGAVHVDELSETGAKQWPEKEFLNPLKDPLPDAPNMKIFCMYGVGSPAERSYHYQHAEDPHELAGENKKEAQRDSGNADMLWKINLEVHDPDIGLEAGVKTSDGDGTVPLISTGLMCYKGWRTKRLNPANIPIVSREYQHKPTAAFKDLRGGPYASAHVEALANVNLMRDVLKVAAGMGHTLGDDITSDIPGIAAQVNCFDDDTC